MLVLDQGYFLSHVTVLPKNATPEPKSLCDEFDPVPDLSDPDGRKSQTDFLLHSRRPNVAYVLFSFLTHKEQTDMPI